MESNAGSNQILDIAGMAYDVRLGTWAREPLFGGADQRRELIEALSRRPGFQAHWTDLCVAIWGRGGGGRGALKNLVSRVRAAFRERVGDPRLKVLVYASGNYRLLATVRDERPPVELWVGWTDCGLADRDRPVLDGFVAVELDRDGGIMDSSALLQAVRAPGRWLLVGPAGSGKSTLLRWLAAALWAVDEQVALVHLPALASRSFSDLIEPWLRPGLGDPVVLLDSLDEWGGPQDWRSRLGPLPERVVLATRPTEWLGSNLPRGVSLDRLALRTPTVEGANQLARVAGVGLSGAIPPTPLHILLAAGGGAPETRFLQWLRARSPTLNLAPLLPLAWALALQGDGLVFDRLTLDAAAQSARLERRDVDGLLLAGLIVETSPGTLRFAFASLHQHLVSEHARAAVRDLEEGISVLANRPVWHQTLVAAVRCTRRPSPALRRLAAHAGAPNSPASAVAALVWCAAETWRRAPDTLPVIAQSLFQRYRAILDLNLGASLAWLDTVQADGAVAARLRFVQGIAAYEHDQRAWRESMRAASQAAALLQDHEQAVVQLQLGLSEERFGNLAAAVAAYDAVLDGVPGPMTALVHQFKGVALWKGFEHAAAAAEFERAVACERAVAHAHHDSQLNVLVVGGRWLDALQSAGQDVSEALSRLRSYAEELELPARRDLARWDMALARLEPERRQEHIARALTRFGPDGPTPSDRYGREVLWMMLRLKPEWTDAEDRLAQALLQAFAGQGWNGLRVRLHALRLKRGCGSVDEATRDLRSLIDLAHDPEAVRGSRSAQVIRAAAAPTQAGS